MPSQPPPGSTSASPRIPAPSQPAPGSTRGSPRTPAMGSTGGIPRVPELSAQAVHRISRKCTVLVDWWLERVEGEEGKICVAGETFTPQMSSQMRKGASSSKRNMKVAGRVFRSSAIVKRHDYLAIESDDGYRIQIGGPFNIPNTRENGFSEEVCESFEFGFPILWESLVNPKMVPDNEHARAPSETTTGPPSPSVEDYMAYFLSDSFNSKITHDYDLAEYSGKIKSIVNGRFRGTAGCGQAEEDADIQQENMHSCSSEHGMVTVPFDCTSSQLGELGIPKSGKGSVNLGTTDVLELPTEGKTTPKFGATRGSEDSNGRRLRSGKVLQMPSTNNKLLTGQGRTGKSKRKRE